MSGEDLNELSHGGVNWGLSTILKSDDGGPKRFSACAVFTDPDVWTAGACAQRSTAGLVCGSAVNF